MEYVFSVKTLIFQSCTMIFPFLVSLTGESPSLREWQRSMIPLSLLQEMSLDFPLREISKYCIYFTINILFLLRFTGISVPEFSGRRQIFRIAFSSSQGCHTEHISPKCPANHYCLVFCVWIMCTVCNGKKKSILSLFWKQIYC